MPFLIGLGILIGAAGGLVTLALLGSWIAENEWPYAVLWLVLMACVCAMIGYGVEARGDIHLPAWVWIPGGVSLLLLLASLVMDPEGGL